MDTASVLCVVTANELCVVTASMLHVMTVNVLCVMTDSLLHVVIADVLCMVIVTVLCVTVALPLWRLANYPQATWPLSMLLLPLRKVMELCKENICVYSCKTLPLFVTPMCVCINKLML